MPRVRLVVEVYSGRLIRFAPNGTVDRIVGLPVGSATSLSFGGPDLDIASLLDGAADRRDLSEGAGERRLFAVHGLGVRVCGAAFGG